MGKGIVKLGEGNWAVKDGNLLAAKETNGRFKNAEFTVTRGTDATYVGKDGLIKTANFYNLMSHSERTTASSMAVLSSTLSNSTVSSPGLISQVLKLQVTSLPQPRIEVGSISFNQTYTISCFVKKGLGDYFGLGLYNNSFSPNTNTWVRFNISTGQHDATLESNNISNVNIDSVGDGWYRISASITTGSTASQSGFKFVAMSSSNFAQTESTDNYYYISGLQVELGSSLSPYQYTNGKEGISRIDFTDNTDGYLLLEPESRNLIPYSEDFEQWAEEVNIDVTNNSIISPDGTQNAAKLQLTGSSGGTDGKISINVSPNATTHTFSVFAKKGSHNYIYIWMNMSVGLNITRWIDLNDGSVNEGNGTATVTTTSFSNDWWKIEYTFDATNLSKIKIEVADDGVSTGTGGDNIYVWGAQLEELSYATSYIPTNGGTVTRDAETCAGAGEAADFNSEEGVLYAEIAALAEVNQGIAISNGGYDNRILFYFDTDGNVRGYVFASGNQFSQTTSGVDYKSLTKMAIKYSATSTKFYVNGNLIGTEDTSSTMPSALNQLSLHDGGGGNKFYGKVKAIRVYKEALSDSELTTLTS